MEIKSDTSIGACADAANQTGADAPTACAKINKQLFMKQGRTLLPAGYKPDDIDVMCGRGRISWQHTGNKKYKTIVKQHTQRYIDAPRKIDKSILVSSLVDEFRGKGILFLKFDMRTKRFYDVGDIHARDKTGHAIRDQISKLAKHAAKAQKSTTRARRRSSPFGAESSHSSASATSSRISNGNGSSCSSSEDGDDDGSSYRDDQGRRRRVKQVRDHINQSLSTSGSAHANKSPSQIFPMMTGQHESLSAMMVAEAEQSGRLASMAANQRNPFSQQVPSEILSTSIIHGMSPLAQAAMSTRAFQDATETRATAHAGSPFSGPRAPSMPTSPTLLSPFKLHPSPNRQPTLQKHELPNVSTIPEQSELLKRQREDHATKIPTQLSIDRVNPKTYFKIDSVSTTRPGLKLAGADAISTQPRSTASQPLSASAATKVLASLDIGKNDHPYDQLQQLNQGQSQQVSPHLSQLTVPQDSYTAQHQYGQALQGGLWQSKPSANASASTSLMFVGSPSAALEPRPLARLPMRAAQKAPQSPSTKVNAMGMASGFLDTKSNSTSTLDMLPIHEVGSNALDLSSLLQSDLAIGATTSISRTNSGGANAAWNRTEDTDEEDHP